MQLPEDFGRRSVLGTQRERELDISIVSCVSILVLTQSAAIPCRRTATATTSLAHPHTTMCGFVFAWERNLIGRRFEGHRLRGACTLVILTKIREELWYCVPLCS